MGKPIDWADYQAISVGTKWDSYCKLQDRIDELEGIIRASFVIWDKDGTDTIVFNRQELLEETGAAIIELCKPRPEAPPAQGDD